ncbi:NMD3 family protein [Loa loa]|uniref:60S ribosomal export protein NMD3 n=1 Tax=Loa loa TaxID=7209 RepID=A0A1I7VMN0_LOALO|nr:NMD3 family protein [Loa loa]EFO25985.2 NMD3 family protein [Loa loa]
METVCADEERNGKILCCQCGTSIEPNAMNMCVACVRSRIDITEGIPKQSRAFMCKFCSRWLIPPNGWVNAERESKEMLAILLKKLKPTMTRVRLIDASFVWTEPHSKRVKLKLTIQSEVLTGAVLQQIFIVEFIVINQMCDDCRRAEAKDFWRACVQVRQKCEFKKTLFYLEQLVLKYGAHVSTTAIKPVPTGVDFFYAKLQDARKFVDFITSHLPCRYSYAQELVTHDVKNNTYDYKHTFCVEVVPICHGDLVCLPKKIAQALGNMNQLVVCFRVNTVISVIDSNTLQIADINSVQYWRDPFQALCQSKRLSEFYVMNVEDIDIQLRGTYSHLSTKHRLVDIWVVPSNQIGQDNQEVCTRSHLGHLLKPGDLVLGYDLRSSNVNSTLLDEMKRDRIPDIILVRKVYDRSIRQERNNWELKRLIQNDGDVCDSSFMENEFEDFLEDLEEDEQMKQKVNFYRNSAKQQTVCSKNIALELPLGPPLHEMMDNLDLNTDVEMN